MRGRRVVLAVLLFGVWVLFFGRPTVISAFIGVAVAAMGVRLFGGMFAEEQWLEDPGSAVSDGRHVPARAGNWLRRLLYVGAFIPLFGWKVVTSGFNIALLALRPTVTLWPGIVRIKGGLPHITATMFLANLITLTPGTLTMDYDEESDDLYVHWIDVTGYGDEEMDDYVTSGMRPWVRRFFQ